MKNITAKFTAFLSASLLLSGGALAQSEDAKAILEGLKALGTRIDRLEKRIDGLEGAAPASTARRSEKSAEASATPQPSPPPSEGSAMPPGMKAVPGWVVNVLPHIENVSEPDPLFRFSQSKLPVTFSAHQATRRVEDWVRYIAEAKLNIYVPGKHVFIVDITLGSMVYAICEGQFLLNGKPILTFRENIDGGKNRTISAGHALEVGNYDARFSVECRDGNGRTATSGWAKTSIDIQIRGPNDETPRPLAANEIFHFVKDKPVIARPASSETKKPKPPTPHPTAGPSTALPSAKNSP